MNSFALEQRRIAEGCHELAVRGELDLATAGQLAGPFDEAHDAVSHLLVNLLDCQFIDSTGIAMIVKAHQAMGEIGCQVIVFGASNQVRRVLEITGLTSNGLVADSLDDALAMCGCPPSSSARAGI